MTIKQQGGVFGRNPTFNNAEVQNDLTVAGELGVKTTAPWEAISVPFNQKISVGSSLYPASFYRQSTGNLNTIFEDRYNVAATAMNFVMRAGSANEKTALSILGTGDVSLPVGNLIVSSGKGIDFSATSGTGTSELFDDYEEGTLDNSGGTLLTANYTFVSRVGQYTKVGDIVTAWFRYEWTSTNLGSGDTILNAMPFTASNNGYVLITECNANIAADQIYGMVLSGTNQIKLYGRSNASTALFGPAQKSVWQTGGGSNILAGVAVFKA